MYTLYVYVINIYYSRSDWLGFQIVVGTWLRRLGFSAWRGGWKPSSHLANTQLIAVDFGVWSRNTRSAWPSTTSFQHANSGRWTLFVSNDPSPSLWGGTRSLRASVLISNSARVTWQVPSISLSPFSLFSPVLDTYYVARNVARRGTRS